MRGGLRRLASSADSREDVGQLEELGWFSFRTGLWTFVSQMRFIVSSRSFLRSSSRPAAFGRSRSRSTEVLWA